MHGSLALGAPGIYSFPERESARLESARMDVCAFVGVAPRGPSRVPILEETWRFDRPFVEPDRPKRRSVAVAVESFDEYRRLYGGFEGPGLLPYAVASFFEQGGRRAYIVRIVHDYAAAGENAQAVAEGQVAGATASPGGSLTLQARSEGGWGNRLRASLGFALTPLAFDFDPLRPQLLEVDPSENVPFASLLRLTLDNDTRVFRFVSAIREEGLVEESRTRRLLDVGPPPASEPVKAEIVTAILQVRDGEANVERFEDLGLSSRHPRWMATVLSNESQMVYPTHDWAESDVEPDDIDTLPKAPELEPLFGEQAQFAGGRDRYEDITPEDFFDAGWTLGDPEPGDGIHAVTHLADLASAAAPDLYSPGPLGEVEEVLDEPLIGAEFEACVEPPPPRDQAEQPPGLDGLALDPALPGDLEAITILQQRVVALAEALRSWVALLDVPPGLSHRQILRWRAGFRSSYAAAYHPWLRAARLDDPRQGLIRVNPSAVAAGIIAAREEEFGIPHGPANALVENVVDVHDAVSPARHDELHPLGINVYLRERDGVRLTGARTLSRDARYRQLSVRRLMLLLRRVLEQQTHWMVFEPNGPPLRADVRAMLRNYLRELYRGGAFRGATEEEAFFVRCDAGNNPPNIVDAGKLVAEVGVAPSEPIEFIVLRIIQGPDGTLSVEL